MGIDHLLDAIFLFHFIWHLFFPSVIFSARNKAWTYLFGRGVKEYATIMQVFNEIVKRDPEFKPQSFFDFGAGIGTGCWAASELWKKTLHEYFLVDQSGDMNDLSELILRDGNENKNMSLKNVFYRQFLPASDEVNYTKQRLFLR